MASNTVRACFRCRQKKIKCDTARPVCQMCFTANTPGDCIYGEDSEFPAIRLLEEKIGQLQERIVLLENYADSQSVLLQNPYSSSSGSQAQQALEIACRALPPATAQELLRSFTDNAPEVGFFLHMPRFLERAAQPHTGLPKHALTLMTAARLLGAYCSTDASLHSLQPQLLAFTLKDLSAALVEINPPAVLDILQAEVLLAHYFFSTNRTVEGVYHMDAASAIVLANRLHKIRSTRDLPMLDSRDDIEEGERINAFWNTFILDRCWSYVLGRSPLLADEETKGTGIDTPWPLNIEAYENHALPAEWRGLRTVQRFIFDAQFSNIEQSPLALHAKAAALYSEARRLATQFHSYALPPGWTELDRRIGQFIQSLPSLDGVQPAQRALASKMLVVHMLAYGATIELQAPLEPRGIGTSRVLALAFDAVNILNQNGIRDRALVDPMVGVVLASAANIFARTLRARRQSTAASGPSEVSVFLMALAQVRSALDSWGRRSAYIRNQHIRVAALIEGV
ncbi:hypothetical protein DAEQUDRAFT_769658 [Daedalea quercina L-15889]|uniref:Zn(2)-C6 fungal-type domain-containing protein n=1 Tax=Daedalea quercina L-15889 TaxID=1314783 RepID=A0A165LJ28_9APHY|nr:hypothetical protein DAEQUDRAFT_769658 [Daedalea quercina L-15889]